VSGDRDAAVADPSGQPGHGRFDGVELVEDTGQVVGPDTPDKRGARVVGGEAERVEMGGLDDDEPTSPRRGWTGRSSPVPPQSWTSH
jgi:hypothetical protein